MSQESTLESLEQAQFDYWGALCLKDFDVCPVLNWLLMASFQLLKVHGLTRFRERTIPITAHILIWQGT